MTPDITANDMKSRKKRADDGICICSDCGRKVLPGKVYCSVHIQGQDPTKSRRMNANANRKRR